MHYLTLLFQDESLYCVEEVAVFRRGIRKNKNLRQRWAMDKSQLKHTQKYLMEELLVCTVDVVQNIQEDKTCLGMDNSCIPVSLERKHMNGA